MRKRTRPFFGLLEKRYPNSSVKFKILYAVVDTLLAAVTAWKKTPRAVAPPKRVLIVNIAHLGDVLIATSILPLLKLAFPDAKIGFLAGSWSLPILKSHPLVDWVHIVDHHRLNRSSDSRTAKLLLHFRTRQTALRDIRSKNYDAAINLFAKPNVIGLLWQAGIPVRIGYVNGGLGPLLTHPFRWTRSDRQISAYHADLLQALPLGNLESGELRYVLPELSGKAIQAASDALALASLRPGSYVVVHMGTGEPKREWALEKWQELVGQLIAGKQSVVLTGAGERERRNAESIAKGQENCLNLCSKLDWEAFVALLSGARLVLCVESVASHVASAAGVPCIAVWSGITDPFYFRPLGNKSVTVTAPVPCAPCHIGCPEMECVRNVTVSEVHETARRLLAPGCTSGATQQ